jgi:hypothetical protein
VPVAQFELPFYDDLDEDGHTRLALILGEVGTPRYAVRKVADTLTEYRRIPQFRKLVDEDSFLLVLLAMTPEKSHALRIALERHTWPVHFRIATVPEILPLTGR